jgi:hypothetical protein
VEGGGSSESVALRLRERVKMCMKIDLNAADLFDYPFFMKTDIIFSSLSLEAAARTPADYKGMVNRLKKYLKPHGAWIFVPA